MDDRKLKILEAIIKDYIQTGEPIGSRTIAKKYDLGVSPATIRNEMADLEDLGYIEQLHSSSGRIPSDLGYRLYVDKLMKRRNISAEDEILIKQKVFTSAIYEVENLIIEATKILSELTELACIVKTPSIRKAYIKQIQLVFIDPYNILTVIVTDTGVIKNNVIRVFSPVEESSINGLNVLINRRIVGLTIDEMDLEVINNLQRDLRGHDDIFNALIPALYESLKSTETSKVYTEGFTNIFNYPEYNNIDKAREFIQFINNEHNVDMLLSSREKEDGIAISIGAENYLAEARDCSVITATYSIHDRPLGVIGVVGPTRMQYDKVISILGKIVKELNINMEDIYKNK
ncbi:heat-inducible transcription repressor HrcA [Clostridium collagenovorans DSM 3089]|uniref:Heat-inducible transcription repressor HrcA n=1 Tax=Clostridium collagenovorans DSM 3089 TaxID=1121306 RepID=A0A1M5XQM6_9CLOT|nr:heat-inducible transcriptional repressor HrcA [Clostridium collagenovorans]SHI02056.1 heat-inducible transcription repressor HrcA [Clostridium collagenovorans DSM 3089]